MTYGIIAKRSGSNRDLRFCHSFGLVDSAEAAVVQVRNRYAMDPKFREKWKGWAFMPVMIGLCFEIKAMGGAILHKNEKEEVIL